MPTKTKTPPPAIEIEEEEEVIESVPEETVTFKKSHFYSVLVVLAFAVGILVGYVAWGRDTTVTAAAPAAAAQQPSGPVVEAPVTPKAAIYPLRYSHRRVSKPRPG